jgi:hypothetical protein
VNGMPVRYVDPHGLINETGGDGFGAGLSIGEWLLEWWEGPAPAPPKPKPIVPVLPDDGTPVLTWGDQVCTF